MQSLIHQQNSIGTGLDLIVLHGLFGSSRNWSTIASDLAAHATVHLLDQRNHGDAGHHTSHNLMDLVGDLYNWLAEQKISNPILLGHSMGGMVAMSLALKYSELIQGLIVVDIAPRSYPPHHQKELAALNLDVSQYSTRSDIDKAMADLHPDPGVRQFLQMNLVREQQKYRWKLNVAALSKTNFTGSVEFQGIYRGPVLSINGGASSYVTTEDHPLLLNHFPAAQIETIPDAGHWLHHSHRSVFIRSIINFLQNSCKQ